MQAAFLLLHLLNRVLFKFGCIIFIIISSCVIDLGLEVETSEKPLFRNSPLRPRVRVDQICRDCESEISKILLMVDLRVMDISDFDVILDMAWLTAHRVVSDFDLRRVIAYTRNGI